MLVVGFLVLQINVEFLVMFYLEHVLLQACSAVGVVAGEDLENQTNCWRVFRYFYLQGVFLTGPPLKS